MKRKHQIALIRNRFLLGSIQLLVTFQIFFPFPLKTNTKLLEQMMVFSATLKFLPFLPPSKSQFRFHRHQLDNVPFCLTLFDATQQMRVCELKQCARKNSGPQDFFLLPVYTPVNFLVSWLLETCGDTFNYGIQNESGKKL